MRCSACSAAARTARLGCRRSTSLAQQLPSGLLHLWTTPVLFERGAGSAPLCEQLTRRALRLHEHHALRVAVDPFDDLDPGGSFYQWQCEQHASAEPSGAYEEMVSSPEFERLRLLVHATVERYLGELEVALPEDSPLDLFIWATVLRADQDHAVHFHPSAVCSGSFYSQVPAGAGGLWLQDPRGTLRLSPRGSNLLRAMATSSSSPLGCSIRSLSAKVPASLACLGASTSKPRRQALGLGTARVPWPCSTHRLKGAPTFTACRAARCCVVCPT